MTPDTFSDIAVSTFAPRYSADGRRIPDVLAPAGGREPFFAALNAGADAVYLGLKSFNARARAENFSADDLRELVPLAHAYGMQVLITVNVLIKDVELPDLIRLLATLEEVQVDAIIVQDLGVARIVRAHFPRLRMHASTQMAVHNLAGVLEAQALGFKRVVLARELTAQEVRKIRAGVSRDQVELEIFCHGSLCYSYSGLCFFSGAEDARSGNRGECAYTCRQPYKILSEPGHGFLFSMRDLDTSESLDLLVAAGVDTLKIEGRKKDAQYVASTVRLYRERLDKLFETKTLRPEAPPPPEVSGDVRQDMALSFQRRQTSFFVKGRYHENVIDLDSPTHAGLQVGTITAVTGRRVTVKAACDLERFDGLRITPSSQVFHSLPQNGSTVLGNTEDMVERYENRQVEFSLREMTVAGKRVATAALGALVSIELPEDAALPRVGDSLHKVRSADLKRRVAALAVPPPDAKPRVLRLVDVELDARPAGDRLLLSVKALKFGTAVASAELAVDLLAAKGPADLGRDLEEAFTIFGDAGFAATNVAFVGDRSASWFVPRSLVKKLKHDLSSKLAAGYDGFLADRLDRALKAIATDSKPATPRTRADRTFAVKTDRLETLKAVATYAATHPEFALTELVFEPKRAFLPELSPAALADELRQIATVAKVKLRLAVPTVMRAWDEPLLKRWLVVAKDAGFSSYEVGNVGAFRLLRDWDLPTHDLASDFTLYTLNSCTSRLWREQGVSKIALSIEDDLGNLESHLERLAPDEREDMQAILFKDTPLFIAEACSLTALHNGCPTAKVCGYRTLTVSNPAGEIFHVAHESCKSIVYGDRAYSIAHRQDQLLALGVRQFRVDFLTRQYDTAQITRVLDAVVKSETIAKTHSANFDRTLL